MVLSEKSVRLIFSPLNVVTLRGGGVGFLSQTTNLSIGAPIASDAIILIVTNPSLSMADDHLNE
jgi:hypothetical protein